MELPRCLMELPSAVATAHVLLSRHQQEKEIERSSIFQLSIVCSAPSQLTCIKIPEHGLEAKSPQRS